MNYLLASAPQAMSAQLRLRGDEVSAVVSDRYAPLDAVEFVETLRQALGQQGLLSSVRARAVATGTTDLMRLVVPSESQAIKVGDVTAVGLDLSTSSFGRSALHVRGLLWRLKCTNGLRTAEGMGQFSYRHVGEIPAAARRPTRRHPNGARSCARCHGPLEEGRRRLRDQCRCRN